MFMFISILKNIIQNGVYFSISIHEGFLYTSQGKYIVGK
jgi:hypothetical protein